MGWFDQERLGNARVDPIDGFGWFPHAGCLDEQRLAYIGLRDIDYEEGACCAPTSTLHEGGRLHGIAKVIEMAIAAIDLNVGGRCTLPDVDGIDPHLRPARARARGGHYREIHYIRESCTSRRRLVSMDLVEVNPALDAPPQEGPMHGDDPTISVAADSGSPSS